MIKKIYVVRHCKAEGQPSESPLTEEGLNQSRYLVEFFSNKNIGRIISSPFLRAIESVKPLSKNKNVKIEIDERLSERILSTTDLPDWYEKLKETFEHKHLKFEGGESSTEAANRILNVVDDVFKSKIENTLIVTHGNIMSLLLNHYNDEFGFEDWRNLSNPDVFQLTLTKNEVHMERLWRQETIIN
ncbi:histidine phosphatase family protein [Mesobacillus sp. LC4]